MAWVVGALTCLLTVCKITSLENMQAPPFSTWRSPSTRGGHRAQVLPPTDRPARDQRAGHHGGQGHRVPSGPGLGQEDARRRPGRGGTCRMTSDPGLWMNHCHNLSHADRGMVLHLAYTGITTPFHGAHGG